ncbi:MAG: Mur ligase family protein, partial [Candidatus Magasanikbacteria bacterium]
MKTLKKWLYKYSPYYPKALVYMLQASEYHLKDYINWYQNTTDFSQVEQRQKLEKTPKALALLGLASILLPLLVLSGAWIFWFTNLPLKIAGLILVLISPNLLAYLLVPFVFLGNILIQKPIEYFLLKKAKSKLKKHQGLKIAIAGSFGKTTMTEILNSTLSVAKKTKSPPKSYNTPLGISKFINSLEGDEEVLIFEFGEYYPGDIKKLSKLVEPDIGIITGINEAHLKKFKDIKNTTETIFELSDYIQPQNLYINKDSPIAEENAPEKAILYSKKGCNKWKIKNPQTDLPGTKFTIKTKQQKITAESGLVGLHQLGPLSAAVHIADRLSISLDKIKKGLKNTNPVEHRLQPKKLNGGVTLIDDSYNGNPDGVQAAIDFLSSLKDKRRIYLTPGLVEMGPKTEKIHKQIGKKLSEANIEKVILIKNSVTPFIEQGLKE